MNGDGAPDLWTTRAAGAAENLDFLPGTSTGLGTPALIGTGGWQWMTTLG